MNKFMTLPSKKVSRMVHIQNNFLSRWANLRHAADIKKAKLDKALRLQHFHADITETKV